MSAKTVQNTRLTDEERREQIRRKNSEYTARKDSKLSQREVDVKKKEKEKRNAIKLAAESGEWVLTPKKKTEKEKEKAPHAPTKNKYSVFNYESDEEPVSEEPKNRFGFKIGRIDWSEE